MHKLTVIIPTKNEEQHIEEVIKSASFADEIMVVDSFSTDKTIEIAKKHTDFILQREYKYSASQKNWAIPQANNEWILLLDADERVTKELKTEVKEILSKENIKEVAFWIRRKNHFMGRKINYSGWQSDAVIRLFRKSKCKYEDKFVHAEIITNGVVGKMKNKLLHYTYTNFREYLLKFDRYTTWGAQNRFKKNKKITAFHLFCKPSFRFFRHYFLKFGFLDGKVGLIISLLSAYSVFLRSVKLWRIQKGENING